MGTKERKSNMTNSQIARMYREAKDKKKQIVIICELENLTKAQVEKILIDEGEKLTSTPERPRKVVATKTTQAPKKRVVKKTEPKKEETKVAAVKVEDVPEDKANSELENIKKVPSDVGTKPDKLRNMPEAVYTALHNELLRLDRELAEVLRRKQEIKDYFIEEGINE